MVKSMTITPVLNGFIVEVGCQKVVCQSIDVLADEIGKYYKNPKKVEEYYMKNAVNKNSLEMGPGRAERAVPQSAEEERSDARGYVTDAPSMAK